jgi:hypothetical protein
MILTRMALMFSGQRRAGKSFSSPTPRRRIANRAEMRGSERLLDVCVNRRTLAGMKGQLATLLGLTSAVGFVANNASAHPGHSGTDIAAQLAAPTAGADHIAVFGTVALLVVLVGSRLALHLIERRQRDRLRPVRRR